MTIRVSVCIATYNGEKYIARQLESIASQLSPDDEIVLVDDQSSDRTLDIVRSLDFGILKIVRAPSRGGPTAAFGLALQHARGEFIFLSDQDDVWLPGKVEKMLSALERADLVVSDACVVDEKLGPIFPSFFVLRGSKPGVFRNFFRNSYVGCCMAFRAAVARAALPIPQQVYMHDVWIGLIANLLFRVEFLPEPLILWRRHGATATVVAATRKRLSTSIVRRRLTLALRLSGRVARLKLPRPASGGV
ncbi:MAG: glycosyltransferase family 2 protein [Nevskia sp.]|nr:glycosyltransferase family 2 protein [Nevskia sp.]